MTLTLHSACREQLIATLERILARMQVDESNTLTAQSIVMLESLEPILPRHREKVGLVGAFSERPLMHFVYETLSAELRTLDLGHSATRPLTSLLQYANVHGIAASLIERFETLPWSYELFIESPLPSDYSESLGVEVKLDSVYSLVVPNDDHFASHLLPPASKYGSVLRSLSRRAAPEQWNTVRYHVRATIAGFIGHASSREPVNDFIARVKSIYGLLLALEIASAERSSLDRWNRSPVLVYRMSGISTAQEPSWPADEDAAQMQALKFIDYKDLPGPEREDIKYQIRLLQVACAAPGDRLLNAARWYFDSFCGSNELLSFVQAMIALEILFGEKAASDIVGIGQLIANRCAYLVGKSTSEREAILADIGRIYATRSAIVHRGKGRLTYSERSDFARLRTLCQLSLRRELMITARDFRGA